MEAYQNLKIEYRKTAVFPSEDELKTTLRPFLRANKATGTYCSEDHYLDTWFRLMREDCIRPLREKIARFRSNDVDVQKEADTYCNVRIDEHRQAKVFGVTFECNETNTEVDWKSSKKLRTGSLVCLSDDGFKSIAIATINDETNGDLLSSGKAFLAFEGSVSGLHESRVFVMIESEVYFEAYRFNLEVLKTMDYKFPLKEVLLQMETHIKAPKYMRAYGAKYDFGCLMAKSQSSEEPPFDAVDVQSKEGWPSADDLGLDESQLEAVRIAITREVAIIQGPPGTGKTFIGLRIVELLLKNKPVWNQGKTGSVPLFIICYTNHALDQFLEAILKFTDKIVRFGRTCESEQLKKFTVFEYKEKFSETLGSMSRMHQDLSIINKCDVIGMTTTGAAKRNKLLRKVGPKVVIVEEAAEVLEPHLVTSLVPSTEHLILIGDHQQLRPKAAVYELGEKYNFEVSLFERLINNDLPFVQLQVQHRMQPSISSLLVPEFYPSLTDHESVLKYQPIRGLAKSVFFVNHSINDFLSEETRSFINRHEAQFIVNLFHYLNQQGYGNDQITILATYSAQTSLIRKLISELPGITGKVRVTSVDGFQGEEADIILLSFVRSNDQGSVGFLKVSNRVNVALSRAKKGLYCIGNFEGMAGESSFWNSIVAKLKVRQELGDRLELIGGPRNQRQLFVSIADDFDLKPRARAAEPSVQCTKKLKVDCSPVLGLRE